MRRKYLDLRSHIPCFCSWMAVPLRCREPGAAAHTNVVTMPAAGSRRARHSCSAVIVVCSILAAAAPCVVGFQVAAPPTSCSSSSGERGASGLRVARRIHQARQRAPAAGTPLHEEVDRRLRRWELALLAEREDGADGGGQEQQVSPPTDVQGAPAAAAAEAAMPVREAAPRRYVGDGAGMADEGGVGGPKGDGRGKEWTVDLCSKRLSLLHRKLRQVKSLQAQQARDPDSLDAAQRVKLGRKQNLATEIAELEALRRDLRVREWERGSTSSAPPNTKEKKSRLPPGPFAGVNANAAGDDRRQQEGTNESEEDEGAEYTRDGLRLASPKRPVQPPKPAANKANEAEPTGGQQAGPSSLGDADLFADGPVGDVSAMADLIKASLDGQEDDIDAEGGGDGGFDWEEGYEDMEGQVAAATAAATAAAVARMSPSEAAASGGGAARGAEGGQEPVLPMVEAPAGGYPKRLAGLMSFCRVSDKATCEILVEMGRVTVNGEVAKDPGIKVDLLTDIIVANGVAVTFPGKIDNSDETRKPRDDVGKRTGPIPKAEKNTWKQKTKYRWSMDDGLLAKRTRRAANAKSFEKKRRSGGGYDDW